LYPSSSVAQNNVISIFTVSIQICTLVLAVGAVQSDIVWGWRQNWAFIFHG